MGFVGNLVLFAAVKEFHKAPFLTRSVQLTILRRHMMYTTENYGNGQPQQPDTHDCRCLCLHILTRIDSNNCPSVCLFSSTHPLPTTYDDPDRVVEFWTSISKTTLTIKSYMYYTKFGRSPLVYNHLRKPLQGHFDNAVKCHVPVMYK